MSAFWEKQKGESAQAFEAFKTYRDMGAARSNAKVGRQLGKSKQLMDQWSKRWMWVARAEAYDMEQDRIERAELAEYRRQMHKRHRQLASTVQSRLIEFLTSIDGTEMTYAQVASLLSASTQLERLAVGEANIVEEHREEVNWSGDPDELPVGDDLRRAIKMVRRGLHESQGATYGAGEAGD